MENDKGGLCLGIWKQKSTKKREQPMRGVFGGGKIKRETVEGNGV